MTAEEQRKIAYGYIYGTDGLPENEKKGWELMRAAADAGDATAASSMAGHLAESEPEAALAYFKQSGSAPNTLYLKILYLAALKTPTRAREYWAASKSVTPDRDGLWYCAKLLHIADPSDMGYTELLSRAASLGSQLLTDEDYAACGRARGVVIGREEFERFAKADQAHERYFFSHIAKDESMARALVEANLGEKEAERLLGKDVIAKIKGMQPEVTLEYEPIYIPGEHFDEVRYTYSHQENDSITRHSGSGVLYAEGEHDYLRRNELVTPLFLRRKEESYSFYGNEPVPEDARIRVSVPDMEAMEEEIFKKNVRNALQSATTAVEMALSKEYDWSVSCISVNIDTDNWVATTDLAFVPCWFFSYKLKDRLVTIRVNATTGDIEYFFDNPFGIRMKKGQTIDNRVTKRNKKALKITLITVGSFFLALFLLSVVLGTLSYCDNSDDTSALPAPPAAESILEA